MLFGSRIINCSQEETLSNLLSRLEEDKSESCDRASLSNKILSRSGLSPFVQHLSDYCLVVLMLNHNIV